jgi:hypothetical protein
MMKKKNKKQVVEPVEVVEPPRAHVTSETIDSVTLHIPLVKSLGGYGSGATYDEYSATVEMLEEMTRTIRHKRSEADTRSESLKISKQGIFWTRVR